ncbi:hypothetical protein [Klebsiella aerogenes]|uniref:helix-turn-helix transcriptional regulator n=1 Tax=Klebsiella aerogenes TaxID=548 RepID=UPI002FFC63B5
MTAPVLSIASCTSQEEEPEEKRGEGRGEKEKADNYNSVVVDGCAYGRAGLAAVMPFPASSFISLRALFALSCDHPAYSAGLTLLRLPVALGPLLEELSRQALLLQINVIQGPVWVVTRLSPAALVGMLQRQGVPPSACLRVRALPASVRPDALRSLLLSDAPFCPAPPPEELLPFEVGLLSLTPAETQAVRDALACLPVVQLAARRGRKPKTLYSQRASALGKLGVVRRTDLSNMSTGR